MFIHLVVCLRPIRCFCKGDENHADGKDDGRLRFSWKLEGEGSQKSYEICLYDENERVVWNSGRVPSSRRHGIYADYKLEPETKYGWCVTVTDEEGVKVTAKGDWLYTEIHEWKALWVEPTRVRKPLTDSIQPIRQSAGSFPLEAEKEEYKDVFGRLRRINYDDAVSIEPSEFEQRLAEKSLKMLKGLWHGEGV